MPEPRRRRDKNTRRADALLGYIIPVFFVLLGGYQQVTTGAIDRYVIGCLLIFGLGALGWRVDVLLEKFIETRATLKLPASNAAPPAADATQRGDDET